MIAWLPRTRACLPCVFVCFLGACVSDPDDESGDASTSSESDESGETETETGATVPSCADPVELPANPQPPIPWTDAGELTIDAAGHSDTIELPIPADARYLAIRTTNLDGEDADNQLLCHALLEAELADGTPLIPGEDDPLLDTHQRSYLGPGAGVFVFSSAAAPLTGSDTLRLRLQLRDCALDIGASRMRFPDMATRVRVEVASEPTPAPNSAPRLGVRLLVGEDSGWGLPGEDPQLDALWAATAARFEMIGVELALEAAGKLPAQGELRYLGDMIPFRPLHDVALACLRGNADDTRFVPVILVPCLRLEDQVQMTLSTNYGQNPRIPGAFSEASAPSLVVLASGACNPNADPAPTLSPESHGVILAHEIGHYLGLHHADQPLGQHLAGGPGERLMDTNLVTQVDPSEAWFSPTQAEVLLRHPDLVHD